MDPRINRDELGIICIKGNEQKEILTKWLSYNFRFVFQMKINFNEEEKEVFSVKSRLRGMVCTASSHVGNNSTR